eukprot:TRINITY_DN6524_c0_g2_i1.p1 TRINITY_DN6524_c0_g2~~TRINITY_DN6524_c0_g2_i1.p1  ORF type:complete len:763 (+),score=154.25 TRINITY_DN6524_c0_g2_i1:33-2321(+)
MEGVEWKERLISREKKESRKITLTPEQQTAINYVLRGENIFFTGCAGTGKTTLLQYIIKLLPPRTTFVTAATGIAAINIGGMTLHKFAGIYTGVGTRDELLERAMNGRSKYYWENAEVLIIDEISMIGKELFEDLNFIAKSIRSSSKPFGGIQLICCGDFFQLPPISRGARMFCFESSAWKETIRRNIELIEVHRQKDSVFVQVLDSIRKGDLTQQVLLELNSRIGAQLDTEVPTKLCSLNREVDTINESELDKLQTKGRMFRSKDNGSSPFVESLQHCQAPSELKLKIGAHVMLLANLDLKKGLANGARGVVVKFDKSRKFYPYVKFGKISTTIEPYKWPIKVQGREVASRKQVPLKLAWAMSIHKCQGQTLEYAEIDLSNVFECGQAYVAFSRVTSLSGVSLTGFNPSSVRASQKVTEFYKKMKRGKSDTLSDSVLEDNIPDDIGDLVLHCVDHVFDKCRDCPNLLKFLISDEQEIKFRVSNRRRKHLHDAAQYFNDHQGMKWNMNLVHESEGVGGNRYLLIKKINYGIKNRVLETHNLTSPKIAKKLKHHLSLHEREEFHRNIINDRKLVITSDRNNRNKRKRPVRLLEVGEGIKIESDDLIISPGPRPKIPKKLNGIFLSRKKSLSNETLQIEENAHDTTNEYLESFLKSPSPIRDQPALKRLDGTPTLIQKYRTTPTSYKKMQWVSRKKKVEIKQESSFTDEITVGLAKIDSKEIHKSDVFNSLLESSEESTETKETIPTVQHTPIKSGWITKKVDM